LSLPCASSSFYLWLSGEISSRDRRQAPWEAQTKMVGIRC
jgi:hypothetical protein